MGAKVDYTRNFIRYSRTETKSLTVSEADTKYDLFEATGDCLIKMSHYNFSGSIGSLRYYVNDDTSYFAESSDRYYFKPESGNKYTITTPPSSGGSYYDMVVLLQKGDKIKVLGRNMSAAVDISCEINIYE